MTHACVGTGGSCLTKTTLFHQPKRGTSLGVMYSEPPELLDLRYDDDEVNIFPPLISKLFQPKLNQTGKNKLLLLPGS